MKYIKGINYAPFAKNGSLSTKTAYKNLETTVKNTNADFIIFLPPALQENPHTEEITFIGKWYANKEEVAKIINHAKSMGLRTALKPILNCMDGTWRAHINFFDKDVPCEPKWSKWFESYSKFILYYAQVAQDCNCEMFIIGCELVQTEKREKEWRQLITEVRKIYSGLISYNTDKYQEDNIKWWDAVDVISSSGYYPAEKMEEEFDRIEKVVEKFDKPFFFAEAGCKSVENGGIAPNDWRVKGKADLAVQYDWYKAMFTAMAKRPWLKGIAIWDYPCRLYDINKAETDTNYCPYAKPAEKIIAENFAKINE